MMSIADVSLISKIKSLHGRLFYDIEERLRSFKEIWVSGDENRIWEELVFCLLTPQSKAEACWMAVESLKAKGLILEGSEEEIRWELEGVRFRNKKAKYIVEARSIFFNSGKALIKGTLEALGCPFKMREWLVDRVRGMGYKEASHFLRNIGLGEDMAILDRHILRCIIDLGLLDKVPSSLSKGGYLSIESLLRKFSQEIEVPMSHLDFIFWYIRTGRIFK